MKRTSHPTVYETNLMLWLIFLFFQKRYTGYPSVKTADTSAEVVNTVRKNEMPKKFGACPSHLSALDINKATKPTYAIRDEA
jgi:hypothetical protein